MLLQNQSQQINEQLLQIPQELSNKEITRIILNEWRDSETITDMIRANEYFKVRNTQIRKKDRDCLDENGDRISNDTLSNVKLPSAFLRKSVRQKVNYAFAKPFLISVEKIKKSSEINNSKADNQQIDEFKELYLSEWSDFLNVKFRKNLKRLAKNAINNGIAWNYVWIDAKGKLQIVNVDSETIYPWWRDREHETLDAIVRDFIVIDFSESETGIEIQKVEYWDAETVERFIDDGGELTIDVAAEGVQELPAATAHMTRPIVDENGEEGREALSWGKVPFIALKANDDELPLLNVIIDRIDAYDQLDSNSVDGLDDDIDPILTVKGLTTQWHELANIRQTIKNTRIITFDEDGGEAAFVQPQQNIDAIQKKLESLRKDIREFACDVDTQDVRFGSNPSGVALKSMYQDLDTYINDLETEFEMYIHNLKYFFDRWLEFKGVGNVELWEQYNITVTLDRDMMINESELVTNLRNLGDPNLSQETLDLYNPAVESPKIENERREKEAEQRKQDELDRSELYQFNQQLMAQLQGREGERYGANSGEDL